MVFSRLNGSRSRRLVLINALKGQNSTAQGRAQRPPWVEKTKEHTNPERVLQQHVTMPSLNVEPFQGSSHVFDRYPRAALTLCPGLSCLSLSGQIETCRLAFPSIVLKF
jgi:hypothetical protein